MYLSESYKNRLKLLSGVILEDGSDAVKHTPGLDEFLEKVVERYKIDNTFVDIIKQFILNSDCKKISIENLKMGDAVAMSDRLILSPNVFRNHLGRFLFILFHETAHQYQFKKYGEDKMLSLYTGDISIKEAADLMKKIEVIADDFAARKIRELIKLKFLHPKHSEFKGFYKDVPIEKLSQTIIQIKDMLKKLNITEPSKISEVFYNWVKADL